VDFTAQRSERPQIRRRKKNRRKDFCVACIYHGSTSTQDLLDFGIGPSSPGSDVGEVRIRKRVGRRISGSDEA